MGCFTTVGMREAALTPDLLTPCSLGEDPETRRMRTVKNIADLRQNLEETMSSLRGTQIGHSTLETTFDSTVTTEVNGRSIPSLGSRSSPMSWRLGQSASPRLQAGDAPSLPGAYAAPRAVPAGRFAPTDPSRFMYAAPLRRAAAGARGVELPEKGGVEGVTEVGVESEVTGYVSDGDILAKNVRPEEVSSGRQGQEFSSSKASAAAVAPSVGTLFWLRCSLAYPSLSPYEPKLAIRLIGPEAHGARFTLFCTLCTAVLCYGTALPLREDLRNRPSLVILGSASGKTSALGRRNITSTRHVARNRGDATAVNPECQHSSPMVLRAALDTVRQGLLSFFVSWLSDAFSRGGWGGGGGTERHGQLGLTVHCQNY
ncbi:hypothetical protein Z043_118329 [Scleropages formosus]|uniref:Uncharacterized protein n=1 Tax=Scleropages formosus TaxID=113540 RepID=A0A0P7UN51_SCLFO|nr:hypothetical protein Z043_118329 [Scleropages formosus]